MNHYRNSESESGPLEHTMTVTRRFSQHHNISFGFRSNTHKKRYADFYDDKMSVIFIFK